MKFDAKKKEAIMNYIMEIIANNDSDVTSHVSDSMGINRDTVYTYIKELIQAGKIRRISRGKYEICSVEKKYILRRSNGELDSENYFYTNYLAGELNGVADNVCRIWEYVISEMVNNVIDHSGAEVLKLVIRYDIISTKVWLVDNGVGIFKKIMEHFNFPSTEDAICELIKGKLTTDEHNHSGEGIFFSSRMMDNFVIISDGEAFAIDKYDDSIFSKVEIEKSGTCVYMELDNNTKKNPAEIFHMYENDDGEFKKSRIALKYIFSSSPVSRSQAKRLCNRFDKFEEITIDFDGIEWIGQGFAHQLFNVFVKDNPEVKLIAVNMCEDVEKMYKHVK